MEENIRKACHAFFHLKFKKNMAEVVVSILESPYTLLQKSGVPLPVCICMQGKGLQLGNAPMDS